jgi:hypothetical protein
LALGRCLLVVLFAHPLFWLWRRAIRHDQELLADAVAAGDARPDYAEELLRWVRMSPAHWPARAWAAVGIWESASQVSRRIAVLLDETFRVEGRGSRRWQWRATIVFVALGGVLSLVTLHRNQLPAQQAAKTAPSGPVTGSAPVARVRIEVIDVRRSPPVSIKKQELELALNRSDDFYAGVNQAGVKEAERLYRITCQPLKIADVEPPLGGQWSYEIARDENKDYLLKGEISIRKTWLYEIARDKNKDYHLLVGGISIRKFTAADDQSAIDAALPILKIVLADHAANYRDGFRAIGGSVSEPSDVTRQRLKPDGGHAQNEPGHAEKERGGTRREVVDSDRAKGGNTVSYTITGSAGAGPSDGIFLPVYKQLSDPEFRRQLGLSAEQEKQLRTVSAKSEAEFQKFTTELNRPLEKLPLSEHIAKMAEVGQKTEQWMQGQKAVRKQIEEILTPQQLDAYRKRAFPIVAPPMLGDPDALKIIALSPQQQDQLRQLAADSTRQFRQRQQQHVDRLLAVLSPEQQKRLRSATDRWGRISMGGWEVAHFSSDGDMPPDVDLRLPGPYYDELSRRSVRKHLGLSDAQQKRLREIADTFERESMKIADAGFRLPEQRFSPELSRKNDEVLERLHREVERCLTPPQLVALKDINFRSDVPTALLEPHVQAKLGITKDQTTRLQRLAEESTKSDQSAWRAQDEKSLGILTPTQQQKLREEVDRCGW